jgi:hypothetical protein
MGVRMAAFPGLRWGFVAVVALSCGCSGPTVVLPTHDEELTEIFGMYKDYVKAKRRPPTRSYDLDPYSNPYANGYGAVTDGRIHVAWNTPLTDTPADANLVLAYEAQVPEKGGRVLMGDGTLRTLSAAAYEAARSATASRPR